MLESSQLEKALRGALADMLSDPKVTRHLAEEIADRLDGFDDEQMVRAMDAAADSPEVPESEVMKILKDL